MLLERVTHPRWLSNSWIVADEPGGTAVIVDTGGPAGPILDRIHAHRLRVAWLLNTHHHHDHTSENALLARETGAAIAAHRLDAPQIEGAVERLEEGQVLSAGNLSIRVLHIPGHTEGQAAFVVNEVVCFTGDTLFKGSIGSTTAPGHTTFADLKRSLVDRLMSLPDATEIAPGHADPTTVGAERRENPFLQVLLGQKPEGEKRAHYGGQEVRLIVWARDYDGGHKAWIRFPGGQDESVPGSRVAPTE